MSARTTLTLEDRLSGPLQKVMKAMNSTIKVMEQMDKKAKTMNTSGLQKARKDIENATAALTRFQLQSKNAGNSSSLINKGFFNVSGGARTATSSVQGFLGTFATLTSIYFALQMVAGAFKKFTDAADNFISSNARLSNINDGLQSQLELQQKIYNAAQRSRTAYNDMAGAVSKLNLLARDAFSSNDEAIRFSELMNKAFTVSGSSTQERQAGMYQLTQAMAAGRLQGDEFRSIMENAPLLAQAIADATGKSMGDLKTMSAEGTITADVIKNALFGAADEIEAKFKNMPQTFAEAMTIFSNWAQTAFQPLFTRFSQFINSDAFGVLAGQAMSFVMFFTAGMDLMFDSLEVFYNLVGTIGSFFEANWSVIEPILVVIGAALATVAAIIVVVKTVTMAWATAQWIVNAAYLTSPITWVILGIVAAITFVIYALVTWANQTAQVVGFITGLFFALGAFIANIFISLWNVMLFVAEIFANTYNGAIYGVQMAFYVFVQIVLGFFRDITFGVEEVGNALGAAFVGGVNIAINALNWLIDAINTIPGIDLDGVNELEYSFVNPVSDSISSLMNAIEAPEMADPVQFEKADLLSITDAFSAGQQAGVNASLAVSDSISGFLGQAQDLLGGNPTSNPFTESIPGTNFDPFSATSPFVEDGKLKGGKLDSVGRIEDTVKLSDEYLELFRDIAEAQSIRNFISLTPALRVSVPEDVRNATVSTDSNKNVTYVHESNPVINNYNTISKDVDVDDVIRKIDETLREEKERTAKGVYRG